MNKSFRLVAVVALSSALAASAHSQQAINSDPDHVAAAQKMVRSGNYLAASDLLAKIAFSGSDTRRKAAPSQIWSQITPFMTNELPTTHFPPRPSAQDEAWAERLASAEPRDAIAEIVKGARRTSIVILNEAHYSPRDRAFALRVARALRPLGYAILAAEAFENAVPGPGLPSAMQRLREDRFVRFGTGFYTLDPVFARFVREALAMGYHPVAYEQTAAQEGGAFTFDKRERSQAENLVDEIFRRDPNRKVLIYVGHGHVRERVVGRDVPRMAEYLKRITGIDPLTIDQAGLTELAAQAPASFAAAIRRTGSRPTVFVERRVPLVVAGYEGAVDLQVVHPPRRYRLGRPSWLEGPRARSLAIPASLAPSKGRRLIQAFAMDAPEDAVPLDQVLVRAGDPLPSLVVPAGGVRYATQDAD